MAKRFLKQKLRTSLDVDVYCARLLVARQRGGKVCRVFWVSPNRGEIYNLWMLLMSTPRRSYSALKPKEPTNSP
ncbi:hypothetical protein J6590_090984 [Homalodisca vitripennis]|nr:hypothetical protein J6590_090984 [Homalodisca vitripennis]